MFDWVTRKSLLILISAFVVALLCNSGVVSSSFALIIICRGVNVFGVLVHELGHSIFMWAYGIINVPMIFTLFGSDQAGGMTMPLSGRNVVTELLALVGFGYAGYRLYEDQSRWLIPFGIFYLIIVLTTFTSFHEMIIAYMGHGTEIIVGSYLIFRACLNIDARNSYERWLNGFFGFFMNINVAMMCYNLITDVDYREEYTDHMAFGESENDFVMVADHIWHGSVHGVAVFTLIVSILLMIVPVLAASYATLDGYVNFEE